MRKPVADSWYGVEPQQGEIIRIRETHVDPWAAGDIWLVLGKDRDLVFDTGTGIVPLEPLVSVISDRPKIAVACCQYYDHAGGLYAFEVRACHRLECDAVRNPPGGSEPLLDEELFALPHEGFRAADYRQKGTVATQHLDEGDLIDLGDRRFEVLHIPGRTPGSIVLWEESRGYLFGGETAFFDPFRHDFPPDQSVDLYEQSLMRLGELPVSKVFGGHYGVFGPQCLATLIEKEIGRYRQ